MIVQTVVAILVAALIVYQIIQGLYSALVMAILSVLSAVAAFSFYEPLGRAFLYETMPAYADGVALTSLFLLILFVLRELADRFVPANVVLGVWANRIGGGVLGLISSLIVVGVLCVGAQMLPFGPAIMGYRPFDESLQRTGRLVPFYPDQFVLGMIKRLQAGGLGRHGDDEPHFAKVHDNLLLELYCARNRHIGEIVDKHDKTKRRTVMVGDVHVNADDLNVDEAYELRVLEKYKGKSFEGIINRLLSEVPDDPMYPALGGDTVVMIVRVKVNPRARDEKSAWWRLPATHFRLVDPGGKSHYPLGYLYYYHRNDLAARWQGRRRLEGVVDKWNLVPAPRRDAENAEAGETPPALVTRLALERPHKGRTVLTIDWVFRLPEIIGDQPLPSEAGGGPDSSRALKGYYMVFRRRARAPITRITPGLPGYAEALRHAHTPAPKPQGT